MRCPKCGNDNLEPAQLCQACGAVLPDSLDPNAVGSAEQPLATMLYRALIGPVHTDYYLQQFARFDAAGKAGITWHWPAFFATLGWLAFRRMWGEALVFAALSVTACLALFSVVPLLWGTSQELLWSVLALYLLLVLVLPALWANAVYYRHCNRQVTQALVATPDIRQTCDRLAAHSSTWRRGWVAAEVSLLVWLVTGAVAAWLLAATGVAAPSVTKPAVRAGASTPANAASAAALVAAPASSAAATSSAAAATSAPVPAQAMAAAVSAPQAAPAPPLAPASAPSAKGSNKQGKFIVAVGRFAQEQNANRAYDKLQAAGLPVHSNTALTQTGTLLLIRVGPYRTLMEARQAAQQIKKLDLPAMVLKR